MKKIKGFTLVELLAAVVVLGILMTVAIPNVIGVLNKNRATTYVEDARKLISNAEYTLRGNKVPKLSNNTGERCALFNLAYLDNNEFENGPYGHPYDKERSFVVAYLDGDNTKYFVRLVEEIEESKDDGTGGVYRGVTAASKEQLSDRKATQFVNTINYTQATNTAAQSSINLSGFNTALVGADISSACGTFKSGYRHTPSGIKIRDDGIPAADGGYGVVIDPTSTEFKVSWSMSSNIYGNVRAVNGARATFKVTISNPNYSSFPFTINSDDERFAVYMPGTTEAMTGTVSAGSAADFEFDVVPLQAKYESSPLNVDISLGTTVVLTEQLAPKTLTLEVDYDEIPPDELPPVIKVTSFTKLAGEGQAKATWTGSDFSGISKYFVHVYTPSGRKDFETTAQEMTFTDLGTGTDTHNIKVVVCGQDNSIKQNQASPEDLTAALNTTQPQSAPCSKMDGSFKWNYKITGSIGNGSYNGTTSVNTDSNTGFSGTISANSGYNKPGSVVVTMGGATQTPGTDYTYDGTTVKMTKKVTGDISITGSCDLIPEDSDDSGCLVEGTEVLLKDGKTKKIEDVDYDDLVAVWNHDTGKIGYEYPIWLEKEHETTDYKVSTFSDGSTLKTTIDHAVFSLDDNEFISVNDKEKYKTGTRIAKIENGKIKEVTLTKVEERHEKVKYYQIISARYFNTITDGFLTSDYTVELPNAYGFEKNITWPKVREEYLSNTENYYKYEDFKDILPYYLFYGLARNGEGKILKEKYGIGLEEFRNYLLSEPLNEEMIKTVETNKNGKRMWMMTTSLDKVTRFNKSAFKYEEGSYYKLPNNKKVKYYKNSVDGKIYKPGEKVKVICGSYFEAIMK